MCYQSQFFLLKKEEILQKDFLPNEIFFLNECLGIPEVNRHYFLEEVTLKENEDFFFALPVRKSLPCLYMQSIAIKIFGIGIRFFENYDHDSGPCLQGKLPNGFLLKQAIPSYEKNSNNRLLLPQNSLTIFCSFFYLPSQEKQGSSGGIIIHQILRKCTTNIIKFSNINWHHKIPLPPPTPRFYFTSDTALVSCNIERCPRIFLDYDEIKNFTFPVGDYILNIRLDGILFPLYWHQYRTPISPFLVFSFLIVHRTEDYVGMFPGYKFYPDLFRFLKISGGCFADAAIPFMHDSGGYMPGSWYFHKTLDLYPKIARIIHAINLAQGIPEKKTLLRGHSMGGFTALKMAEHLTKAQIFAYNTHTDFMKVAEDKNYSYRAKPILKILTNSSDIHDIPPHVKDRVTVHPERMINKERSIIYCVNNICDLDFSKNFIPFLIQSKKDNRLKKLSFRHYLHDPNISSALKIQNGIDFIEIQNGINFIEYSDKDSGHASLGSKFELRIIDSQLTQLTRK
jgi:hypothetical protein